MSQLTINTWFPVAIGQTHCPFINEVQSDYLKIISKFKYNENGFCYEDIHKNKKFLEVMSATSKNFAIFGSLQRSGTLCSEEVFSYGFFESTNGDSKYRTRH